MSCHWPNFSVIPTNKRDRGHSTDSSVDLYDFLVVQSGGGGSPLPARLAMAKFLVLLIETGVDQDSAVVQQVSALQLAKRSQPPIR